MTKHYTEEFRGEAVRLAVEGKQSRAEIAQDLGVSTWTLREWVGRHKERTGESRPPRTETLEEENSRLRRDIDRLKMERDILKKAAAYFAKEQF